MGDRKRLAALAAAVAVVAAGLGVRAVAGGEPAKYAGDALYTVLVQTLVLIVAPRTRPGRAAGLALALSWAVEFFQITGLPARWSAESTVARLVLGSTFNGPDLLWYAVGAGCGWLVHRALSYRRGTMPAMRTVRAVRAGRPDE
ncbi:DUF2809 domain-containing protein [Kitasatospora sp. NPDC059571]|uniref:ribosomal maturation YjgA family protein n=1 Tax=Kitasatospora sp. NPDC059571 TaxID=3346871 RepID=UPI0036AE194E